MMERLPPLTEIQQDAIDFIWNNWAKPLNSLCALGVGLGKTRIACEIIHRLINSKNISLNTYTLVCCSTTSTRDTIWSETLNDYRLKVFVLSGDDFERIKMKNRKRLTIPPHSVCLITYAALIRSESNEIKIIDYFKNSPPSFIVFDEFHTVSNSFDKSGQMYRKVILELPSSFRLGLTATPLVNDENEMVVAYGILNNPKMCRDYLEDTKNKTHYIDIIRQKPFFYHKHLPYSETPPKDWLISIPMERELYAKYQGIRSGHEFEELTNQQNQVLRLLIEGLYKNGKEEITCKTETGKIKALRTIIRHINQDEKILVFDSFTHTLDYIAKQPWMRLLNPVVHHGKKAKNENVKSYRRFLDDPECRVFLTTRSQCAEGINLQVANHVVIMNCWWTVKDLIQMIGRIKRKGQTKPVYSYLLGYNIYHILANNIENKQNYLLPEEILLYKAVSRKVYINDLWGINVREQMPVSKAFYDPITFEKDFGLWLDGIIIPDVPRLDSGKNKVDSEQQLIEEERRKRTNDNLTVFLMHYLMQQDSSAALFESPADQPGFFPPMKGFTQEEMD